MKLRNLSIAALALASTGAFAQSSATATANIGARILRPISITKNLDMEFGTVVSSAAAGTVILAPNSTRSVTGGVVTLGTQGGPVAATPQAASFSINGSAGRAYTIATNANSFVLTDVAGTHTMTVDTLSATLDGGAAFTPSTTATAETFGGTFPGAAPTDTLLVGGTLHVGANQVDGDYTAAKTGTQLIVTAAYN